jgi:hypothetical protein
MKILSFDIGIRNLAYCYMEVPEECPKEYSILDWGVIDLCYGENKKNKCTACKKNGLVCNKLASYGKNEEFYCRTHAKNNAKWVMLDKEIKINKSTKNCDLLAIIQKHGIDDGSKTVGQSKQTKTCLIEKIEEFVRERCLSKIDNRIKVKASQLNLIEIGRRVNRELSALFKDPIDHVIIENQIGPLANRMKSIQCFIAMYFIINGVSNVEFISASNKLCQVDKACKDKYNKRKLLSILKTRDIIENRESFHEWVELFNVSKKQDDLADSFLQCLWFINKKQFTDVFAQFF